MNCINCWQVLGCQSAPRPGLSSYLEAALVDSPLRIDLLTRQRWKSLQQTCLVLIPQRHPIAVQWNSIYNDESKPQPCEIRNPKKNPNLSQLIQMGHSDCASLIFTNALDGHLCAMLGAYDNPIKVSQNKRLSRLAPRLSLVFILCTFVPRPIIGIESPPK